MRGKKVLIGILLTSSAVFSNGGFVFATDGSINSAIESSNIVESDGSSFYYFIHYDGGEHTLSINENAKLTLIGWVDESKTSVKGKIEINKDSSNQLVNITINVNDEINVIPISEKETIQIKVAESDSFLVEKVNSPEYLAEAKNANLIEGMGSKDNLIVSEESSKTVTEENTSVRMQNSSISTATAPSVKYSTHVQDYGWLNPVSDGETSGTEGQAKKMEAIKISLENAPYAGDISYSAHVQDIGWLSNVSNGGLSGTTGQNKRLEAIKINLTGEIAQHYDIYYRVHSETFGWLDWAKNGESAGTQGLTKRLEAIEIVLVEIGGAAPGSTNKPFITNLSVTYSTHVQDYGWLANVSDGIMSGTEGQAKKMEAIKISLKNAPYSGDISYSSHVQDLGWVTNVSNGGISGTTGQNKRLEAIKIKLTGEMAQHYDIYYRVHAETYGWLDWAKNGEAAGTQGLAKRLEAIEIVLVEKGKAAPGPTNKTLITRPAVTYSTHVQDFGWLADVSDGKTSGTEGQAKKMEAIKISLGNSPYSGGISYSAHVQDLGWVTNVSNGEISGTTGQNKRLEAIKINLTGEMAQYYDIYYRVHAQDFGWLDWAKNGEAAGTQGLGKSLEAIEIVLVTKGGVAPGSTNKSFLSKPSVVYSTHVQDFGWLKDVSDGEISGTLGKAKRMEAIKISLKNAPYTGDISYSAHVQDYGWLTNVSNGELAGTTGQGKRVEAIKINLSGEMALHYDIYYRVHSQDYGWMDWANNGEPAGTKGLAKQVEAIEIKLVEKGGAAPGPTNKPFIEGNITNYYNITLTEALNMQMKVTPQTDKYRDAPAYVSSQGLTVYNGGSITGSSVNLRTSPNINNTNIAGNVGNGTLFKVLDANVTGDMVSGSTKWYKIEYNGKTLYVHSSLAAANLRVGQTTMDYLNIREEKSATSHSYAAVRINTLLIVLEEDNSGWYRVSLGAWRNAKASDVQYYLDPRQFVNDEKQRFQFMDLTKLSGVSVETLNKYLVGKGILANQGQAFIDAGKKYGINEVYLMAHTLLETGKGTSTLAKGVEYNGKTVYNMYGVGALDSCPDECGAKTAYEKGWFTPYDAIVGGAAFIDDGYLGGNNGYKVVQNTLYEMRWNPQVMATLGLASHQYATDIGWASKQVQVMYDVYKIQPYTIFLEIPVYK
jgi:uncharacterized protein YjdB/beta-N-acetylglucosaminidase